MPRTNKIIAITLVAATLAGCASDAGPREQNGAVAGALAGGIAGALLGGRGGGRVAGAVVGAVAGGLLGGAIGASLDEQDRRRAYAAEMQALEYGQEDAPVGWRGETSGYYGTVVPGPYYESGGRRCRRYSHTVHINGQPQVARGVACRNPDGSWTPVS